MVFGSSIDKLGDLDICWSPAVNMDRRDKSKPHRLLRCTGIFPGKPEASLFIRAQLQRNKSKQHPLTSLEHYSNFVSLGTSIQTLLNCHLAVCGKVLSTKN